MIKREFWEKVADVWAKKEEIYIPEILDIPDVPDDLFATDDVEDLDDLLKGLLSSDSGEDLDLDDLIF